MWWGQGTMHMRSFLSLLGWGSFPSFHLALSREVGFPTQKLCKPRDRGALWLEEENRVME